MVELCDWNGCGRPAEVFYDDRFEFCEKHAETASRLEQFESGFGLGLLGALFSNLRHNRQ